MPQGTLLQQPSTKEAQREIVYLGNFADHESLCTPHIQPIREVLSGQRHRYKLQFENARFIFDHGCLMSRIALINHIFAFPAITLDENQRPFLQVLPAHQQHWIDEFLTQLPKSILLFYFTLLREVFESQPLMYQPFSPLFGQYKSNTRTARLVALLQEVGWHTREAK